MNSKTCSCTNIKAAPIAANKQTKKKKLRFIDYTKMFAPAVVFALIPKCPVCLAGYIALGTGIGLSFTAASYVRFGLIILCIVSLVYFIVKHVSRWLIKMPETKERI